MNLSEIELPPNRRFGIFLTTIFTIAFLYFMVDKSEVIAYLFLFITILCFAITLVKADILEPLNRLWMGLGLLLGKIVSPIVMGALFFGLFTPLSITMKLFGRDELHLKFCRERSHWKVRTKDEDVNASFKNQF